MDPQISPQCESGLQQRPASVDPVRLRQLRQTERDNSAQGSYTPGHTKILQRPVLHSALAPGAYHSLACVLPYLTPLYSCKLLPLSWPPCLHQAVVSCHLGVPPLIRYAPLVMDM